MFNDALDRDECLDMIKELKNCKIPFQCAHGRPSVAPIVDLTKLKLPKKTIKLDLSKLRASYWLQPSGKVDLFDHNSAFRQ